MSPAPRRSGRPRIRTLLPIAFLAVCGHGLRAEEAPIPALYREKRPFLDAIRMSSPPSLSQRVTGITVPHHLLAADLISLAFASVRGQRFDRVIILSPDHFRRSATPFAATRRSFQTALGPVGTDCEAVEKVLLSPLVSESDLFYAEHGIQAVLPFIAYHFPQAEVVPVAIRPTSTMSHWSSLAEVLLPLVTPDTLIVQSTDFSHDFPFEDACRKDQETLRILATGDPAKVALLDQPAHLDSRGAQYLQLRLQLDVHGARPSVIASENSQKYSRERLARTTSYIVQVYSCASVSADAACRVLFAGDTFFGRFVARALTDGRSTPGPSPAPDLSNGSIPVATPQSKAAGDLVARVLRLTGGAPLIVNLEGVVMERCPEAPGAHGLCMEAGLAVPLLKAMNIAAVSIANNHSLDYGAEAAQEMVTRLRAAGIDLLQNAQVTDFGCFRVASFSDISNQPIPRSQCLTEADLRAIAGKPSAVSAHSFPCGSTQTTTRAPVFAFLHWGEEYSRRPGPREDALSVALRQRGVELILGSHPHCASDLSCTMEFCEAYSLGNFIFDQLDPQTSGALLEVTFFPQGTYFLRLHPIENLYATVN
ncbi:MAG: AmmeMemoRadiSam system protein B [Acidobacteriota bacterium]